MQYPAFHGMQKGMPLRRNRVVFTA